MPSYTQKQLGHKKDTDKQICVLYALISCCIQEVQLYIILKYLYE